MINMIAQLHQYRNSKIPHYCFCTTTSGAIDICDKFQ